MDLVSEGARLTVELVWAADSVIVNRVRCVTSSVVDVVAPWLTPVPFEPRDLVGSTAAFRVVLVGAFGVARWLIFVRAVAARHTVALNYGSLI